MLSKKLLDDINEQIKNELYSAYLYLAMAAQYEAQNLPGIAHWLEVQSKEETGHAMKFYEYVNDQGGRVVLKAIDQPPVEFGSPIATFEQVLEHEKKVTALINKLYAQAVEDKDYASQVFLQWFITEQVEEEKNATQIIENLKLAGEKGHALIMIDRALAAR